jgi:transposase
MRPQGTAQQLEKRRRQAIQLLKAGKNLSAVASAISSSVSSVFRWYQAYQTKGLKGLQPQPTPGRPPKLTKAQRGKLEKLLLKGPLAAGYRTDMWTLQRVAEVIDRQFGIRYHPSHVWKLLASMKWSCQKPERRALQRDEEKIAHWKRYQWPHIKKRGTTWGPSGVS